MRAPAAVLAARPTWRRGWRRRPARAWTWHRGRRAMRAVLRDRRAAPRPADVPVLSAARPAPARALRARALHAAEPAAPSGRSWSSTARRCPRSCWPASCSATPGAPSPARSRDQPGRVEAAARRHPVPRRDRRDPPEPAGQAAAFPAGQGVRAGGRDPHPPGRRARGGGHQPRPRGRRPQRAASARTCCTASTSSR